jgi:hypothetical protein
MENGKQFKELIFDSTHHFSLLFTVRCQNVALLTSTHRKGSMLISKVEHGNVNSKADRTSG